MTTTVEDIEVYRKLMDSGPNDKWVEATKEDAEYVLGNLHYRRDAWANGEWYLAKGYGRVVWHETEGDQWKIHPRFVKKG